MRILIKLYIGRISNTTKQQLSFSLKTLYLFLLIEVTTLSRLVRFSQWALERNYTDFEMRQLFFVKNETTHISSKILLALSYWHSTDSKVCEWTFSEPWQKLKTPTGTQRQRWWKNDGSLKPKNHSINILHVSERTGKLRLTHCASKMILTTVTFKLHPWF